MLFSWDCLILFTPNVSHHPDKKPQAFWIWWMRLLWLLSNLNSGEPFIQPNNPWIIEWIPTTRTTSNTFVRTRVSYRYCIFSYHIFPTSTDKFTGGWKNGIKIRYTIVLTTKNGITVWYRKTILKVYFQIFLETVYSTS